MTKLSHNLKSILNRAERYASSLWWLLRQHLTHTPILFSASVAVTIVARVAPLLGFVATIKVLSIMLSPQYGGKVFSVLERFGLPQDEARILIICVPVALFLMAGTAVWAAAKLSEKVMSVMSQAMSESPNDRALVEAYRLRKDINGSMLNSSDLSDDENDAEDVGATEKSDVATVLPAAAGDVNAGNYSNEFFQAIRRFHRVERQFLIMVELGMVLVLISLLGMVLNPVFMSIFLLSGLTFLSIFVFYNQRRAHALAKSLGKINSDIKELVGANRKPQSGDPADENNAKQSLERIAALAHSSSSLSTSFRTKTRAIGALVQGFFISVILVVIAADHSVSTQDVAQFAIMVVMVRYVLTTIQGVSNVAIALTNDYPFLVEIINREKILSQNQGDASA